MLRDFTTTELLKLWDTGGTDTITRAMIDAELYRRLGVRASR